MMTVYQERSPLVNSFRILFNQRSPRLPIHNLTINSLRLDPINDFPPPNALLIHEFSSKLLRLHMFQVLGSSSLVKGLIMVQHSRSRKNISVADLILGIITFLLECSL